MSNMNYEQLSVSKLLEEYRKAAHEVRLKDCYCKGILQDIASEMRNYYRRWIDKDVRCAFNPYLNSDAHVKILNVKVDVTYGLIIVWFKIGINPNHIRSVVRWTKAEQEILPKLRKHWDEKIANGWGFTDADYWSDCCRLATLKNRVELVRQASFTFDERAIMMGAELCSDTLVIENTGETMIRLCDFR